MGWAIIPAEWNEREAAELITAPDEGRPSLGDSTFYPKPRIKEPRLGIGTEKVAVPAAAQRAPRLVERWMHGAPVAPAAAARTVEMATASHLECSIPLATPALPGMAVGNLALSASTLLKRPPATEPVAFEAHPYVIEGPALADPVVQLPMHDLEAVDEIFELLRPVPATAAPITTNERVEPVPPPAPPQPVRTPILTPGPKLPAIGPLSPQVAPAASLGRIIEMPASILAKPDTFESSPSVRVPDVAALGGLHGVAGASVAEAAPSLAPSPVARFVEPRVSTAIFDHVAKLQPPSIQSVRAIYGMPQARMAEPATSLQPAPVAVIVEARSSSGLCHAPVDLLQPALDLRPVYGMPSPVLAAPATPAAAAPVAALVEIRSDAVALAPVTELRLQPFSVQPEYGMPRAVPAEAMLAAAPAPAARLVQPSESAHPQLAAPSLLLPRLALRHTNDAAPWLSQSVAGPAAAPAECSPSMEAFEPGMLPAQPSLSYWQSLNTPQPAATQFAELIPAAAAPAHVVARSVASTRPLRTIHTHLPGMPSGEAPAAIPEPGFIFMDFYLQAGTRIPGCRLERTGPAIDIIPPAFNLRGNFDRVDDPAPLKVKTAARPGAEVLTLPEAARRRANSRFVQIAGKIAACLVLGTFVWFGARALEQARSTANERTITASAEYSSTQAPASGASVPSTAPKPAGKLAKMRQAIAARAATEVTDTFHSGMEAWGSPAKSWAPGWTRHKDGYVYPGNLALFSPSLKDTNYRLEFFSQIENKSVGWAVRAKDKENYYAMKFTVIQPGLRPVIAIEHYPVIGGKKGHHVSTPLNVMVHNKTPFHVAIDVQGNRLTASVAGQKVDSWTDELQGSGGVGFFSEAGEKARLYWMKVSKNQDWLGVICSFIAGSGSTQIAELWGPGLPPDVPQPEGPQRRSEDVTLAAAMAGTRTITNTKDAKISNHRRIRSWNS